MTSVTIQIGDDVLAKMIEDAATCGMPLDAFVSDILAKYLDGPAQGLIRFFKRADREGWRSTGAFMTDDEMYSR